MQTPINISNENFGSVPKYYLVCEDDEATSPDLQHKMCRNYYGDLDVTSINSDHSPFLSHPEEFASYIANICIEKSVVKA